MKNFERLNEIRDWKLEVGMVEVWRLKIYPPLIWIDRHIATKKILQFNTIMVVLKAEKKNLSNALIVMNKKYSLPNLYRTCLISLITILLVGCVTKKEPSDTVELESVSLTKDLTILADNAEVMIGEPEGISTDANGNIYVADTKLQKIHHFSPEGGYQESIGREGNGPGEFDNLNPDIRIKSDTLYILQNNAREIDLFDLNTSQHVRTLKIPDVEIDNKPIGRLKKLFPLQNGNLLISSTNPYFRAPKEGDKPHYITVSKIDPLGNFIDRKVVQLPTPFPTGQRLVYLESNSVTIFSAEFYPDINMASDSEGNLYIGKNDSLNFQQYNQQGELIGEPKGISMPVAFTDSDLDSLAEGKVSTFKKAVNEAGKPDYWPSFQHFIVDDSGRCWVKQLHPGNSDQIWQVLDSNGDPKWTFEFPSEINLFEVKQGYAYGILNSAEALPEIIRYKYTM